MYSATGIYSLPEAARLIRVPARKIHRWLYGYQYSRRTGEASVRAYSAPLWRPQLSAEDFETEVIGFNDLLEIRFVAAFVEHGVPLVVVRRCLKNAREISGAEYPMTSGSFKTDGKTIFSDAVQQSLEAGDTKLLDLKNRQFAFSDIIRPSLYAGIEYDGKNASRWYPMTRRDVVLDPKRDFGSPILERTGTPTAALYASYLAEGAHADAVKRTARIYDAPVKLVEVAINFEQSLTRTTH